MRSAPNSLLRGLLRRQGSGARCDKMPSLHIDLHQGKRKSEINWLNGAVVARGKAVGVPTPVNTMLTDTITQLMQDPQQQALWHGNMKLLRETVCRY